MYNLNTMDTINIYDLEVYAYHGVFPEEKKLGQKFLISATLYTDTYAAGHTDNLGDSINYADICQFITKHMTSHTCDLIEKATETLAQDILLSYPLVKAVTLELKKPWAPIGLPLKTVSVKITRGWHTAYIALGSNIGDKEAYLDDATQAISEDPLCQVERVSDFIATKPYGYTDQDDFLNGAVMIRTLHSPLDLLAHLQKIEKNANRVREIHWGPRTLDLDIIFYDNLIIDEDNLKVPHPDMINRDFVLAPLSQIAPNYIHPVYNKCISELLLNLRQR